MEFVECEACKAKPGTPLLCESCLANRQVISTLTARVAELTVEARPWRTARIVAADSTRQEGDGKRHGEMSIELIATDDPVTLPGQIEWRELSK